MEKQIEELLNAANALKTVKVDGNYWLIMQAVYNSIVQVANQLKEEGYSNESCDNGANA